MRRRSVAFPAAGFSLVELAIVLVIVSLLLGGMMISLSVQYDQRSVSDTQKKLSEISEALLGYAASHPALDGKPFLPCPDTDNDGFENRTGNSCTLLEGRLPWNDLGIGREDSWGNRFRYRVTPVYANNAAGFILNPAGGTLRVCDSSTCATVISNNLPVIVVSHGKNGAGAFNAAGATNPAPLGLDEISNQNADNDFAFHTQSNTSGSEFDDLVIWISPNILYNRMISAGRLP